METNTQDKCSVSVKDHEVYEREAQTCTGHEKIPLELHTNEISVYEQHLFKTGRFTFNSSFFHGKNIVVSLPSPSFMGFRVKSVTLQLNPKVFLVFFPFLGKNYIKGLHCSVRISKRYKPRVCSSK